MTQKIKTQVLLAVFGIMLIAGLDILPKPVLAVGQDLVPPTAPTQLSVAYGGDNFAKLSWQASADSFDPLGVKYTIYVNDASVGSSTSTDYTATKLLPRTQYTFTVSAADTAGNVSPKSNSTTYTTEYDMTMPTVSLVLPLNNALISGLTTFSATSTDDVAVASVRFLIDGQPFGDPITASPYNLTVNSAYFVKNSKHRLTAQAADSSGNTAVSAPVDFTVGALFAPLPTAAQVGQITNNSAVITWQTSYGIYGIVRYGLSAVYDKQIKETSPTTSHQASLAGLQTGQTYHYMLESEAVGFTNSTTTDATFTTVSSPGFGDTAVPIVSIASPPSAAAQSGLVTITVSASDPDAQAQVKSGVGKVWLNIDDKSFGSELYAAPFNFVWDTAGFANSRHTVKAFAADNAGNTASTTVEFTVNNPAPGQQQNTSPGAAHPNGALILDGKTVYLIKNGKLSGFRDEQEYKSYGYNFSQVAPASSADLRLPSAGEPLKAMPGTLALDKSDNRTIYMIGSNGTKRGFASAGVFTGLGYNFKNLFKINLSDYPAGEPLTSAKVAHPEGALVKDGQAVWWIYGGQKRALGSNEVLASYGFSASQLVKANSADLALPLGETVKLRDGALVKQGNDYYVISDGKKIKFSSDAAAAQMGYKLTNAISAGLENYESAGNLP